MTKNYRSYEPRQGHLLPPSPLDWLPEGHLAYFILDVVGELDLAAIYADYEQEERGYPPYHPKMMVALLLYAYCVGCPSSRRIERKTHEDVAVRVIAAGQHPDHSRINEFRRRHAKTLEGLFVQILALCQRSGLVQLGHVALDGTKFKANASKHKAMSYGRMKKVEAELAQRARELLELAERVDAAEDAAYGKNRRGDELPEELRRTESRLAKIREAKAALEAEARTAADDEDDEPEPSEPTPLPPHRVAHDAHGEPTDKAQRNFTDPESRIQKTNDGFVQGYNCQAAVDEAHQVIVAQAVSNQPPDVEYLIPMTELLLSNLGDRPKRLTADAGYFSEDNVEQIEKLGVDPYIATMRLRHGEQAVAVRGRTPRGLNVRQRMARKLATKKGRGVYARRKAVVEPVFGQIKHGRGFRQFLLRGVEKVRTEWSLICTTHNLLKLHVATLA